MHTRTRSRINPLFVSRFVLLADWPSDQPAIRPTGARRSLFLHEEIRPRSFMHIPRPFDTRPILIEHLFVFVFRCSGTGRPWTASEAITKKQRPPQRRTFGHRSIGKESTKLDSSADPLSPFNKNQTSCQRLRCFLFLKNFLLFTFRLDLFCLSYFYFIF